MVLLAKVVDPTRFGVAIVNTATNRIHTIREKPTKFEVHDLSEYGVPYAVTGIYFYDSDVFDIVDALKPSSRNELEITDVNVEYLNKELLQYKVLDGWWTDAGTYESMALATRFVTGRS